MNTGSLSFGSTLRPTSSKAPTTPWSWCQPFHTVAPKTPRMRPPVHLGLPHSAAILALRGWGGAMSEDALSKAERYRKAATRYSEWAKQAEPGYLAEVYRKI